MVVESFKVWSGSLFNLKEVKDVVVDRKRCKAYIYSNGENTIVTNDPSKDYIKKIGGLSDTIVLQKNNR